MQLSYKWLKELINVDLSPLELSGILTELGLEVEEVIDQGKKYKNFVTAYVMNREKHPDADKLSVCTVTDGETHYNVVCGAPNVSAGQKIAFGKIGAIVPSAGFALEKRKLRGVLSEGMICSQTELEVGDDSSGIWVLPENTEVGIPLEKFLQADDYIFDLSITPNKADCLSHIGVARDLSAYLKLNINKPEFEVNESESDINSLVSVTVVDKENCPRYAARVIENVTICESPRWLQAKLRNLGLRPLNAAVDVTNFVLMEYGQPLHAFDLNKISKGKIIVKSAKDGEKFTTLDGKERELKSEMLLICDYEGPIAIGGVMGGSNSEITNNTTNIILESAYFRPSSIRKTSRKLGLQSDASYRFERGVDPEALIEAMDRAAALIAELCNGKVAKGIIDIYPDPIERQQVFLRPDIARKILGIDVSNDAIKEYLQRLGFINLKESATEIIYEVPSHRVDVRQEIDLIEEIARMYNYNSIEPNYSSPINFSTDKISNFLAINPLKRKIANFMASKGFNEIVTQNLVDLDAATLYTETPIRLANPLTEEMSVMRSSVVPSMLKVVRHNIRQGNQNLKLFEIGKVFRKGSNQWGTDFIEGYSENEKLILIMTGNYYPKQWGIQQRASDFYDLKGTIEELSRFFRLEETTKFKTYEESKPGFSKNLLGIYHKREYVGIVGEVEAKILKKYDIKQPVYMAVLDMEPVYRFVKSESKFTAVSHFPSSERDLAFLLDKSVPAGDVLDLIKQKAGKLLLDVRIFDIYEGKGISEDKKSVAFSLTFVSSERTLTENDIDLAMDNIIPSVIKKFNAILRDSK